MIKNSKCGKRERLLKTPGLSIWINKMKRTLIAIIILLTVGACASTKNTWRNKDDTLWNISDLSPQELQMANELLSYGWNMRLYSHSWTTLNPSVA